MTKRIILAGLAGGVAMYVWLSIAHIATPLGRTGVQEIPNEASALAALQASLGSSSGLYSFPAIGSGGMADYAAKLVSNPSGLLVYHPPGASAMTVPQLVTEFAVELLEALLAAALLARTNLVSYGGRVGFVVIVGLVAALTTNVSYWNWFGFPGSYTAAYMFMQIVGYLVAGLAIAAVLKPVRS